MQFQSPYLRLMRLHQPTGIWLLLWPCWWSVAMASSGLPSLGTLLLLLIGAAAMRGAGCIINDMIDRDIDREVARTRIRPLASGELSLKQAGMLLAFLLLIGLMVAILLGIKAFVIACASMVLVVLYPLMKRITWWPQLFLGFTFNWGALVGWVAVRGMLEWPAFALYAAGIFWTLGYDTIYAHQDKADDVRIGVKSTALRLGEHTKPWLWGFYGAMAFLLGWSGWGVGMGWPFYLALVLTGGHLAWQIIRVNLNQPEQCLAVFRSNGRLGWILFLGVILSRQFS